MVAVEPYLARWALSPLGPPRLTHTGAIHVVRQGQRRAVLKLSTDPEELRGGDLMKWWDGHGTAKVLAHDGPALLMECAEGPGALSAMAQAGEDQAACRILCSVAQKLHALRKAPPRDLIPLDQRFRALEPAARTHGGLLQTCHAAAQELLATPQEVIVLHGDLHHDNVLDFGARGWRAIDPKGLWGERGFDFANIFLNPDLAHPSPAVAADPAAFHRRLDLVASLANLPRARLLRWVLAWSGLSMAWFLQEGQPAPVNRRVAELAQAALQA